MFRSSAHVVRSSYQRHATSTTGGIQPSSSAAASFHCDMCHKTTTGASNQAILSHLSKHVAAFEYFTAAARTHMSARKEFRANNEVPLLFSGDDSSARGSRFNEHLRRADQSQPSYMEEKDLSVANWEMTALMTQLARHGGLAGLQDRVVDLDSGENEDDADDETETILLMAQQIPFVFRGERTAAGSDASAASSSFLKGVNRKRREMPATIVINSVHEPQLSYAFMALLRDVLAFCSDCPTIGHATVLALCPREVMEDCSTYCRPLAASTNSPSASTSLLLDDGESKQQTLLTSVSSNVTLAFFPAVTDYSMCHIAHDLFGDENDSSDAARPKRQQQQQPHQGAVICCTETPREVKSLDLALPPTVVNPIVFQLSQLDAVVQVQRRLCVNQLRQAFLW